MLNRHKHKLQSVRNWLNQVSLGWKLEYLKKCYFKCVIVWCVNMDLTTHLVFLWVVPFTWSGDWRLSETLEFDFIWTLKRNRFYWIYFQKTFCFTQSPSIVGSNVVFYMCECVFSVCPWPIICFSWILLRAYVLLNLTLSDDIWSFSFFITTTF